MKPRSHKAGQVRVPLRLVAVLALVLTFACADEPAAPPVPAPATLSIVRPSVSMLSVGDTIRLGAQVRDQYGRKVEDPVVAWSSEHPQVAEVAASGLVRAWAPGTATIAATVGGTASGTVQLSVYDPQYAVLLALYVSTGGDGWTRNDNWGGDGPLGDWHGVVTDGAGRVTGLNLDANNLVGRIPPELGDLSSLKALDLSTNALAGGVPAQLGRLAALEELRLGDNPLSGPLPLALAELRHLRTFGYEDTDLCVLADDSFETWLESIPNHRGSAVECAPPSDRDILVALYEATGGPGWEYSTNWLTDAPLDEWYGVSTDWVGRVVRLELDGRWDYERGELVPSLKGPLPAEIGGLDNLRYLSLRFNALTGPIPAELGGLSDLETLQLGYNGLTGPIPKALGGLANLRRLSLGSNELRGPIPPELGNLGRVTSMNLRGNGLTGVIPKQLGGLTNLLELRLDINGLSGPIPLELGDLSNVTQLYLGGNLLTGHIPAELGRLADLESLDLRSNKLSGQLPKELGALEKLRSLSLSGNALTGLIPPEIGSLSSLNSLGIGSNELTGSIPRSLLKLVNLTRFSFGSNDDLCAPGTSDFTAWLEVFEWSSGPFCNQGDRDVLEQLYEFAGGSGWTTSDGWLQTQALEEWHGITADSLGRVVTLDLERNGLSGRLPARIGDLGAMTRLRIYGNPLSGRLPLGLAELSLAELRYAGTELCVPVDESFQAWLDGIVSHEGTGVECAPLPDREILEVLYEGTAGPGWTNSENWLSDSPLGEWHGVGVDSVGKVARLVLGENGLTGQIPMELGGLTRLRYLDLQDNRLSGPIPAELGNLTDLEILHLGENELSGAIPTELGSLTNLWMLNLYDNRLSGPIPAELGALAGLLFLRLHENELSGAIPAELGSLTNLWTLNLYDNRLSGPIPAELGGLASLEYLRLYDNALTGPIRTELGNLATLQQFLVELNDLSGPIPPEFGKLVNLREMGLSGNARMAGPLPAELTALDSMGVLTAGNTGLCIPTNPRFQTWLEGMHKLWIARCASADPPLAYLTQAVQSRSSPVPLVAGREALLRVFVTAVQANEERIPPVRASFHRDGQLLYIADIPGKSGPIPTNPEEGSLSASANAEIPAAVIGPGLEMVIEVDPQGTVDPALGVARRIPATGRLAVDVRTMPVFDLTLVPFIWSVDRDSSIVDLVEAMAADPEGHEMFSDTRALLPIADFVVTAHEPVLSTSNNGRTLLRETRAIRTMEGGMGHYLGMMSPPVTGGVAGVAYRPGRSSFSVPRQSTVAHELGHNMSLMHAPCGRGTYPRNVDPGFPHRDGSTGAWGYDFRGGGGLLSPLTPDLMSYCGAPDGVSDYHFTNALRFRLSDAHGAGLSDRPPPTRALLVWGGVDSEGTPYLEPAFVVDAPPALPSSPGEHRITGRTVGGGEVFSLGFAMPEVADGDGSSSFAFVLPVQPEWQGRLASITLSGPGGAVSLDGDTDRPMVILRDPGTGQVRGFLRDVPSPRGARAAAAATGAAGAARGLERLFSRGIPDGEAWRR